MGSELRDDIIHKYSGALNELARKIPSKPDFISESQEFINQFDLSGDMSIDLFLSKFPKFEFVGKTAIIYLILQAEHKCKFQENLINEEKSNNKQYKSPDDWMWHLYNKLTNNENKRTTYQHLNFSNISFITFNYDRSLEEYFFTRLENGFNYKNIGGCAEKVFNIFNIKHVYGKVCDLPWQGGKNETSLKFKEFNIHSNSIEKWIPNIKLIGERTDGNMDKICSLIREADQIFFMGFRYDLNNLEVLGFPDILSPNQKIYGTGLGFYNEEIEEIKNIFSAHGDIGIPLNNINILDINCTSLLRRFYRYKFKKKIKISFSTKI